MLNNRMGSNNGMMIVVLGAGCLLLVCSVAGAGLWWWWSQNNDQNNQTTAPPKGDQTQPQARFVAGKSSDGKDMYSCFAKAEPSHTYKTLGKTWPDIQYCEVPFNGKVYKPNVYDLPQPAKRFRWAETTEKKNWVRWGKDKDGNQMYICRGKGLDNIYNPGKSNGQTCWIPWNDKELAVGTPNFQLATYDLKKP